VKVGAFGGVLSACHSLFAECRMGELGKEEVGSKRERNFSFLWRFWT